MQVRREFRSRAEWLKAVRAKQWIGALTSRAARTVVRRYPTCSGNDPGVMV
jgi:hypothetical protein